MSAGYTEHLAGNIVRLRRRTGISREEMARRAGIDRSHALGIEDGTVEPSLEILLALIDALGTTSDEILDGVTWRPDGEEGKVR